MEGAKGKTEQEIRDVLRLTDDKTSTSNLLAHRQVALRVSNKVFLVFLSRVTQFFF